MISLLLAVLVIVSVSFVCLSTSVCLCSASCLHCLFVLAFVMHFSAMGIKRSIDGLVFSLEGLVYMGWYIIYGIYLTFLFLSFFLLVFGFCCLFRVVIVHRLEL